MDLIERLQSESCSKGLLFHAIETLKPEDIPEFFKDYISYITAREIDPERTALHALSHILCYYQRQIILRWFDALPGLEEVYNNIHPKKLTGTLI